VKGLLGRTLRNRRTWLIGIPVVVVLAGLVGPFVYVKFIQTKAPPPLSFADASSPTTIAPTASTTAPEGATTTTVGGGSSTTTPRAAALARSTTATTAAAAAASSGLDGTWRLGSGSVAGYRIHEYVGVQPNEAVGRTEKVTGELRLRGTTVEAGQWTVDMASVKSNDARRDENYRKALETDTYPTSTFVLRAPIALGSIPADGVVITRDVTGDLTLHGRTRSVTFTLQGRRRGGRIEALGSIPVKFSDYDIANPSNGYARTDDHGVVEFLLLFDRAG
jgi:polyisoprenoid-binding protein YceI